MTPHALYLLPLAAFLLTWCIFPLMVHIAHRYNIVDNPDARKLQKEPVPVLGGVAVAIGIFIPLILAAAIFHITLLWYEIAVMFLLVLLGVTDDVRGLTAWTRFLIEVFLIWFLIWRTHLIINDLHGIWGLLPLTVWSALPLSLVAGVGIINAINLIDGVDGYSSGYGILANTIFAATFLSLGDDVHGLFSAICAAALLPFFLHNVFGRTSKMFIGDGGSLLIGFIMVCDVFALLNDTSVAGQLLRDRGISVVAISLAVLCIPVFDTLRVMCMRLTRGVSPFTPDKTHLHHLFIDMGFSHVGTSVTILSVNLLIILTWWLSYRLGASYDLQFYLVILLGLLSTFVFYPLMRRCQQRNNALWQLLTRIGSRTHFEQQGAWLTFQRFIDWNPFHHPDKAQPKPNRLRQKDGKKTETRRKRDEDDT